jgi:hypothetical protein
LDRSSIIGIVLGVAAIVAGNVLEGGDVGSIVQGTAAAIVFGGTFGATLVSFPFSDVRRAGASLKEVFFGGRPDPDPSSGGSSTSRSPGAQRARRPRARGGGVDDASSAGRSGCRSTG